MYEMPEVDELHGVPIPEDPPVTDDQPQEARTPKSFADIKKLLGPTEWDWKKWIARGYLHIIGAQSGDGKSAVELDICKTYTTGAPFPDGSPYNDEIGYVLWCETEAAQVIHLDRCAAWGIPTDRIYVPFPDDPLMDVQLTDPAHAGAIATIAMRPEVRFIVIDSLRGAHRRNEKEAGDMAPIGKWLAELARDINKPIMVTQLLRKKSVYENDDLTLDRISGSTAIIQFARIVWAIDTPDALHKEKKRLKVLKSNLDKFPDPIGFTFDDNGLIHFGDAPEAPKVETQLDKAIDLLHALLAKGPEKTMVIEEQFRGAAISWRTANTAKKKLNLSTFSKGGAWYWSLPAREDSPDD
ncbi:MAG: AAA family ATPase [Planctomycetes bacterium]|nr:AAA family ATPase [Planctomycetota bacterium]